MTVYPNARTIHPGEDGYDFLHKVWLKQGKPFQFDYQGDIGGMIVFVYDYQVSDTPSFHLKAEAGPTLYDETAPGGPMSFGFEPYMLCRGQIRYVAPTHNRRGRITKVPLPMERSRL